MHDIWNPWHGCKKKSEGCKNCYMYFLDAQRDKSGAEIYRVKNNFNYPIQKNKNGEYKIKSGEYLRVCMTSDFFLEDADDWRDEAWDIIQQRKDVVFIFVTKRPERVLQTLPKDLYLENIWFHVTCENQDCADERIPILLDLPFLHKGIMIAPFIGKISISKYLQTGQIENVWAGGENYNGARPLFYNWVKSVSEECKQHDVSFSFFETGNIFIKDNKKIVFTNKTEQSKFAYLQNLNYESSKKQEFNIIKPEKYFQVSLFDDKAENPPYFKEHCQYCLQKKWCVGCSNCGKCSA
jgi:protein gp37